jgi:DNA invertase Pin-like site-specific DNA recombinase
MDQLPCIRIHPLFSVDSVLWPLDCRTTDVRLDVMSRRRAAGESLAIAYVRVSTDTDRQALGAEGQRQAIEAWARKTGTTIVAWHVEEVSGGASLDKRPVLLAALADVAARKAGTLVVQRLDRFSREPLTAALAEAELRRHGAALACADGAGSGDDPTSELVRGILLHVARFEKAMIKARIKAALAVKQSRGELTGAPRYGKRLSADGRTVEDHPEEQATLAEARRLRGTGMPLRAIVSTLADRGMLSRVGKPFTVAAMHKMTQVAA